MKVAMVSEHASPLAALGGVDAGGQNVHVAALARGLARRGHRVTVFTRRDDPDLPAVVPLAPGVVVRHLDAGPAEPIAKDDLLPFVPLMSQGLAEAWGRNRPDVIHSHFWMSGLAATTALTSLVGEPPPLVHTYHALGVVKRRELGVADTSPVGRVEAEAQLGRAVDAIIATCGDEVCELVEIGIPAAKVTVAPCGVDLGLFSPFGPAEQRGREHRIAVVGRLVPRKGIALTICALAILAARKRDDVRLLVVGGPGSAVALEEDLEARRLMALAEASGVRDRIEFRGHAPQSDLPALLRSVQAVVCAPWYEPFGIVPLEAMSCGVPVIAARVGGLADTVVDGVTGIHVPPRDPESIARAIEDIIDNPDWAAELGRAGRRRVCALYSWDRVARETERVYAAVLVGSSPAELSSAAIEEAR